MVVNTNGELPVYGTYVLVSGINSKTYGVRGWHVCEMNDLEDGMDFKEKGKFYWLTENGTKIEKVIAWCELPEDELMCECGKNTADYINKDGQGVCSDCQKNFEEDGE
jgi:hypothetical protein